MATYPSPTLQDLTVNGAASLADVSSAAATITGGTIDGTPIGNTTRSTVKATSLDTSGTATLNSVSSASATLTGGTIDGVTIGGTAAAPVTATNLEASGTVSGTGFTNLLAPYTLSADLASTVSGNGAALVGFKQTGASAVARTVEDKGQEFRTVKDNGAIGDGSHDDGADIASAIADYSGVCLPPGTYANGSTAITLGFDDVALFDHNASIINSGTGSFTSSGTVIRIGYNPGGMTETGTSTLDAPGLFVDKRGYGNTSFSGIGRDYAIVGAIRRAPTSGSSAWAIGGYAIGAGVVALYGQADADSSTTTMWGLNTRTIDNGLAVTQMWGAEIDMNVTYAGNTAVGVDVIGGSTVAPNSISPAYRVGPIGTFQNPVIPWGRGFFVDDGAALVGIEIGATAKIGDTGSSNKGSCPLDMYYLNGSGSRTLGGRIAVNTGGALQIDQRSATLLQLIGRSGSTAYTVFQIGGNACGFFNAVPVGQQTATGNASITANTGTAVLAGSTFTGGAGSTAYTIGDVVKALKNYGLLVA